MTRDADRPHGEQPDGEPDGGEQFGAAPLNAEQFGVYLALVEIGSLLQHGVEQQLRTDGDLSFVQFQILARLRDAPGGQLRMTDLADGVVYSRSGLTYQAGLLEKAGLITRAPAPTDDRGVVITLTETGQALLAQVLPGHVEVVRQLLFDPLDPRDLTSLGEVLTRVRDHMRAAPPRSAKPRAARARPV